MLKKYRLITLSTIVVLLSLLAGFLFLRKTVTLVVDGQTRSLVTSAFRVGDALRVDGLSVTPADRLDPPANTLLTAGMQIRLEHARPVIVMVQGVPLSIISTERLPEALLQQAGVVLAANDRLEYLGQPALPGVALPPAPQYVFNVHKAVGITLQENGQKREIVSAAATVGQALWDNGMHLQSGDILDPPAETLLITPLEVTLRRAVPLTVRIDGQTIETRSAATSIGQALLSAGVTLQGLDYSQPAEDQPVQAGMTVRVVRVREEIKSKETVIPFTVEYKNDAETDLDTRRVITAGQVGIQVSIERVRYEDGKETSRQGEGEWTASQPVAQVVGLGTRASIKSMETPDGPIEYYRAVSVYATSYSPCRQGMGKCSKSTSSGIPLTKGIVAVTLPWYRQFAGQRIYIPGYGVGVIGDVGGGIPGTSWIDLGYDEENFINWHDTVTIYFLAPVPTNVPLRMP